MSRSPRSTSAHSPHSRAPPSGHTTPTQSPSGTPRNSTTSKPSFIPAWRRPTLVPENDADGARRPSVQFVPHVQHSASRSSSAKPPSSRKISAAGNPSSAGGRRLSSPPPPAAFRTSVSFDTFRNPAASDFSLTLNRKHRAYEYTKRSRTFLCGTDTNDYSDTALEWLIDELVDDGDEVVCLRVVEKDSREALKWSGGQGERGYRREAGRMLAGIESRNTDDRAISLVLEFSIGKVQETIQQMIRIYEPAMLVVGTRGRSLTGYQGLLSSGSVSKYCLQYSPVPVIVVRPSRKREEKKRKRMQDPSRTGYRDILDKSEDAPRGRGGHLLDAHNRSSVALSNFGSLGEMTGNPDEEARKVAEAIGYRPGQRSSLNSEIDPNGTARSSSLSRVTSNTSATSDLASPGENQRVLKSPELRDLDTPPGSDDDLDDLADYAPDDLGRLQESVRPEDEALMLAYERAQKVVEEEREAAAERERRERERKEVSASRGKGIGRPGSRGRGGPGGDDEEGGGAAVLGLLAQLDRGIK